MLTANIIRRLDRERFAPELCCLKERGELGEALADEIPVHHDLLRSKYDLRVWPRLTRLLRASANRCGHHRRRRRQDVLGPARGPARRRAGRSLGAAQHGLAGRRRPAQPDADADHRRVHRRGRIARPIPGREHERFRRSKVAVIPNGVDTRAIRAASPMSPPCAASWASAPTDPVVGIVAALRPEKNHELFLEMARRVVAAIAGRAVSDRRRRPVPRSARTAGARIGHRRSNVLFLGSRDDVPRLLAAMDVFALTSHIEANPVSILEAMSVGRPVVATNVGSIHEAVVEGETGFLVPPGDAAQLADRVLRLAATIRSRRHAMGAAAREAVVERWSIEAMVRGYERLIESIYDTKDVRRPLSVVRCKL